MRTLYSTKGKKPIRSIRARKKAIDMGRIANSITNGGGNLAGFIGEIVVTDYIKAKEQNTYDYDIVDKVGNKIDVKNNTLSQIIKNNEEVLAIG